MVEYFDKAQQLHDAVMKMRGEGNFDRNMIKLCTDALLNYYNTCLSGYNRKPVEDLVSAFMYIYQTPAYDKYSQVCMLGYWSSHVDNATEEDVKCVLRAYISLRSKSLEYLLEKFPPVWIDGKYEHEVTGCSVECPEWCANYTLEQHYAV